MADLMRFRDPLRGINNLQRQMDDMFDNLISRNWPIAMGNMPTMDVYTTQNKDGADKELIAEVHASGFGKDDFDISVHEGILEIRGEKREKEEDKQKKSYMVQESSSSFYRRMVLPRHADADKVDASFENGMLKVVVPFKELPKPKKVNIKSGNK
jgi:HSP20 family protein